MDEALRDRYVSVMGNVGSFVFVLLFVLSGPLASAVESHKPRNSARLARAICQNALQSPEYDSFGNELPGSAYRISSEEDRRRLEPGPDEVEDRNPDEIDAADPGEF